MKKGNSKDTAPKRPGRPKKKVIGGEKVLKEYRSKRRKLTKMKRAKYPTAILPPAPKVISKGAINEITRSIDTLSKIISYKSKREKLFDLATKVDVGQIPDTPKNITWASVNKLTKMVKKYQNRWELKQQYTDIRSNIEALPWDVRLPKIPDIITEKSVSRLEKIYEKYKDKAPKYRDKLKDLPPEDVEKSIEDLDRSDEEPETERDEYDIGYDQNRPLPPDEKPQPIEDEVLDAYRDFVSKALDYTEANEIAREVNNWRQDITMEFWAKIYEHGMNCLDMISKLENENDETKRKAVQNLIIQAGYIYRSSEEYLFVYTTYHLADEGASILEDIEKALREATGNEVSDEEWKKWSEIHGQYGEFTFDM